jgi:hypothetical protein
MPAAGEHGLPKACPRFTIARMRDSVAEFLLPEWLPAFMAIEDDSPTPLAGVSVSVRVRRIEQVKKFLVEGLKAKKVWDEPVEHAYYLVTGEGLHVGQNRPPRSPLPEGYTRSAPKANS